MDQGVIKDSPTHRSCKHQSICIQYSYCTCAQLVILLHKERKDGRYTQTNALTSVQPFTNVLIMSYWFMDS